MLVRVQLGLTEGGRGAGAEQMLRDALAAGARVGIIAGTCSAAKEGVVHAALTAMGDDLVPQVQARTPHLLLALTWPSCCQMEDLYG